MLHATILAHTFAYIIAATNMQGNQVSTKHKSNGTLTLKKPAPEVKRTLEQMAQEAAKAVWDYRLAELKALRHTAGYED